MAFDLETAQPVEQQNVSTTKFDITSAQDIAPEKKDLSPVSSFLRSIMRTSPIEQFKRDAEIYGELQKNPSADVDELYTKYEEKTIEEGLIRQVEAPMMLGVGALALSAQPLLHIARLAGFTAVESVVDLKGRLEKVAPGAPALARDAAEGVSFLVSAMATGGGELAFRNRDSISKAFKSMFPRTPKAVYFETAELQKMKEFPEVATMLNITQEHLDAALNGGKGVQIPFENLKVLAKDGVWQEMKRKLYPKEVSKDQTPIKEILAIDETGKPLEGGRITVSSTLGKYDPELTMGVTSKQSGIEGLLPGSAREAKSLSEVYDLDLRITGGAERGHKLDAKVRHADGKKIDLSMDKKLTETVESWGKSLERINEKGNVEPGYVRPDTGAVYWRETDHWDVEIDPRMMDQRIAVNKVMALLKAAKPVRGIQEKLYTQERGRRMKEALATRAAGADGEAGFKAELGALKGELPKVDFSGIRNKLTQREIDSLFQMVTDSEMLGFWETISTRGALAKMFMQEGGVVPTKGELSLLNKVFGNKFVETLMEKRDAMTKFMEATGNILNIPRSLMSSFDLSAPLRQGVFLVGRGEFYKSFGEMFKYFKSDAHLNLLQQEIASRPTYRLMQESKLALTDLDVQLVGREEAFMSNLAEKIPFIGAGVRASGRAYIGFLNKLRADTFDSMIKESTRLGLDPVENRDLSVEIAKFINNATGRGDLGALNSSSVQLSNIFFSPRLIASRMTLLNPAYYVESSPYVRQQALKSLASFVAVGSVMTGIISLAYNGRVGTDIRSSDFGKVIIDRTRIDVWGGFQPYIRMAGQLVSGKYVSSTTGKVVMLGEGYKPLTRLDILQRQIESKLSPVASFIVTMLKGQTWNGKKVSVKDEVVNRMTPMVAGDLITLVQNDPSLYELFKIMPLELMSVFGMGINTYEKK